MAILNFDLEEVERLLLHSQAAKAWSVPYTPDEKGSPGLILVKDQGIYLMSNGKPGLFVPTPGDPTRREAPGSSHVVVYARGFDPMKGDDTYEKSRAAVGGDDFAEHLPADLIQEAIDNGRGSKRAVIEAFGDDGEIAITAGTATQITPRRAKSLRVRLEVTRNTIVAL